MQELLSESIVLFNKGLKKSNRPEDRELVRQHLAELAPILANTILGEDATQMIHQASKNLSNGWVVDMTPFKKAFDKWWEFEKAYQQFSLRGATVNERLWMLGLMDEYDDAKKLKDAARIEAVLRKAHLDEENIRNIIKDNA